MNLELESLLHVLLQSVIAELLTWSDDKNNHEDFDSEIFDKSSITELLS